mmetsp:Transcript_60808/g.144899  ORF Transcript_60808/g.144899 Transcript_60808/m.144899 type:complete len:200 (+) Transcript_60808:78-677(+)
MDVALLGEGRNGSGKYGTCMVFFVYMVVGSVLMGTYIWGILTLYNEYGKDGPAKLWGRIHEPRNEWLLNIYYYSIGAATVGFFPSLAYAFRIAPLIEKKLVNRICGCLFIFYVTECFWLPMCVSYIEKPKSKVFLAIRIQLGLSAIAGLGWAYFKLIAVPAEVKGRVNICFRILGYLGTLAFALHCAILDAIVWPPYFK